MVKVENEGEKIRVRRGKVDSLNLYEITEDELYQLSRGHPSSIFLNFSIFSFSVSISFLISLLTTNTISDRIFIIFVIVTLLGLLSGLILIILWKFYSKSKKEVIKKIKSRIPPTE